MNSNVKEIFNIIPDFEEFMKLTDEIGELSFKKMKLEKDIKAKEADVVKVVTSDQKYFSGGKPLSMSFIDSTYKYTGLDNELLQEREALADITAQLEKRKLQLAIYKDMLEVWRTLSANERSSAL